MSDIGRSVAFYREVVGLPVKFQSSHWTEFDTGAATLALHPSKFSNPDLHLEDDAQSEPARTESRPPRDGPREPAGSCRPGFAVPDLAAFYQKMVGRGVPCVEEPREVFGSKIAQYPDPDGLAFSVGGDWDK